MPLGEFVNAEWHSYWFMFNMNIIGSFKKLSGDIISRIVSKIPLDCFLN